MTDSGPQNSNKALTEKKLAQASHSVPVLHNPLILSLDVDTADEARSIMALVGGQLGSVKVGPRLILRNPELVKEFAAQVPVFLDFKFFDIPSTMVAAVQTAFDLGATLVTVHAQSGREALLELAKLEQQLQQQRPFKILAVTILTSWSEQSFPPSLKVQPIAQHVRQLAEHVLECGLSGVVCSPLELDLLQDLDLFKVTPGIRAAYDSKGDQSRTLTPREALQKGAHGLVIGRPILQAADRLLAIQQIFAELK